MADKSVYLNFGADTGKLEADLARANAEVRATAREMQRLAAEMQKTGAAADSELGQKLNAAGARLGQAKSTATTVRDELAKLANAGAESAKGMEAVGHASGASTVQIAESVHVVKALADELAAGQNPLRALAMEGGRIGQILSMGIPAAVVQWAGLGAVLLTAGGAMAYFAYQAIATREAIKGVRFDAALEGLVAGKQDVAELLSAVQRLGNVGAANAQAFIKPFLALGPVGEAISAVASQYLPAFIANGKTAQETGEQLAKAFADISKGGGETLASSRLLTEEERRSALAFVAAGDKVSAYKYVLEILARSLSNVSSEAHKEQEATEANMTALTAAMLSTDGFTQAQGFLAGATAQSTAKVKENEEELGRWILKAQMASDAAARLAQAMTSALKVDQTASSIKAAEGQVKEFQDALAATKDPESIAQLNRSLEITQDRLKRLRDEAVGGLYGGTTLERIEKHNVVVDQQNQGPRSGQLKQELPGLQAAAADPTLDAKQREAAEQKAAAMVLQIRDAEFEENKARDDLRITEVGKNSAEIIAIRQKEVAEAIRIYGEGNAKTIAAEQALAQARQAAEKAGGAASNKAARDELSAAQQTLAQQITVVETAAHEKIKLYGLEAQAKQITEAEKLRLTLQALEEEKAAVDRAYASEIALAGNSAAKIAELKGRQKIFDLENAFAVQQAQEQAAIKTTQAWNLAAKKISSALDGQVSGLLSGTTSWADATRNVLKGLIDDIVKFFLDWGVQDAANLAKHLAINAGWLASDATTQSASTAQHIAGAAAKKAVDATTVQGDAARAAAGAFAAVAGVPLIGPVLAPAAAAAAYAGTMAFASFDIGAYKIPEDMPAMVHRNELVMPAAQAGAFRQMLDNAAGGGEAAPAKSSVSIAPQTHFHVSAMDGPGVASALRGNQTEMLKVINQAVRDGAHLGLRRVNG